MPFRSRAQMRTCYGKRSSTSTRASSSKKTSSAKWDCDEWLSKTENICCLPEKVGSTKKCRPVKKNERVIGKVQTGPRGGRYFIITEKNKGNKVCEVKVYLNK